MHFQAKNTLKNNRYHNIKQALQKAQCGVLAKTKTSCHWIIAGFYKKDCLDFFGFLKD
jgi:hypothetical protein